MKTTSKILILGLVMVMALCYANSASADTDSATGAGATASVDLDFQIVIPSFIYFRVDTATAGTVDVITFSPTGTDVSTGTTIGGTGGDAGPGAVNVDVISNGGNITITEANNSGTNGLGDGGGVNYISYAQINTADGGNIPAPTLSDGGGNTSSIVSAGITVESDVWTYTYTNPATPPAAGTYGTSANGGRVTYTAAIP